MVYKNLNTPATLVHSVNGKKYTLNGKLLAVNESAKLATMQFGDKISEVIPLSEVYLTESSLSDVLSKAKKGVKNVWKKIKALVKSVAGLIVPVDENGNEMFQFINAPINLPAMPLPDAVKVVPSDRTIDICKEYDVDIINNSDIDEAFEQSMEDEREEIETYWSRVMKEYADPMNENVSLKDTVKMVNEKYYHNIIDDNVLNETIVSLKSPNNFYGEEIGTDELIDKIIENIIHQLNPINDEEDKETYVKPLMIWGAPGIGKTAIIKQAAKFMKDRYDMKLDLVTVCCGGLKPDDFELPDTVTNLAGNKIAISTPKTWLPVFDKKGLTPEEIARQHEYYNSGKYRIRVRLKSDLDKYKDYDYDKFGETFYGGIIFFDEFGRLRNLKTMDALMTFCGDRTYNDMILASHWTTIAAANRLSDDERSEIDADFRALWDAPKKSRFTPYTYVPTKEEWLKWAREVDAKGYQNVDELICKFIEKTPDGVWYDALSLGSREIDGRNADAVKNILNKWQDGQTLTVEEIKTIGNYISQPGNSLNNLSMFTWNGRTWHQKVSKVMLSLLKNSLFYGDPSAYEACFSETKRVRDVNGGYGSEEYTAKNLDMAKLKDQLNKVPDLKWAAWTAGKYKAVDPSQILRNNDRLGFFLALVQDIIQSETGGKNSFPSQQWHHYNSIDSVFESADIKSIYENGQIRKRKNAAKEDNILFPQCAEYNKINSIKWKANIDMVNEVVSMVLDSFNKFITPEQLMTDIKRIKKNVDKPVTPEEVKLYKDQYTIHLTDETGKEIKTIQTLLSDRESYEDDSEKRYIHVLKNSQCARYMANLTTWISKISIQISQKTPIIAALGQNGRFAAVGTISSRYVSVVESNPECAQILAQDDEILKQYDIPMPARSILETMKRFMDAD